MATNEQSNELLSVIKAIQPANNAQISAGALEWLHQ